MFGKAITRGLQEGYKTTRLFIRKRYFAKTYQFNSLALSNPNKYFVGAYEEHEEQKQKSNMLNYVYAGLFLVGFYLSDYMYSLSKNSKESYRLHLYYPNYTNLIDSALEHQSLKPWVEIANKMWVKDFVEFRSFWDRVGTQLWAARRKSKEDQQDAKALKLKKEYLEFNLKYPAPNKQAQQNLY